MTIQTEEPTNEFRNISSSTRPVHWLPFAAKGKSNITKCDVKGYFVVETDRDSVLTSTFRGRALKGLKVNTDGFHILVPSSNGDESCDSHRSFTVNELIVWNHDDVPLKSDVVPQAIALARLQQALGST